MCDRYTLTTNPRVLAGRFAIDEVPWGILGRQRVQGWGAKVIERLMRGFSRTNLLYMRAFAEGYPKEQIVQQLIGQIPRGHNVRILDLVKDPTERLWYAQADIRYGWRRIWWPQTRKKLLPRPKQHEQIRLD